MNNPKSNTIKPSRKVKLISTLFLTLFLFCSGFAQTTNVVAVELEKMNVFFLDTDNPIQVTVPGYEATDLEVCVTNGTITPTEETGHYNVRLRRPGNAHLIVVAARDTLIKKEYRVDHIFNPIAKVAGRTRGSISKGALLCQDGISCEVVKFDFDIPFQVIEFTVAVYKNEEKYEAKSKSHLFTPEQRKLMEELLSGDILRITNIKCLGPDGQTRELAPIQFKIC